MKYTDNYEALEMLYDKDFEKLKIYILNCDINYPIDEEGSTLLMQAVVNNFYKAVELLLKNGADVNIQEGAGLTALHLAGVYNSEIATKLLLEHNADISLKDAYGNTALGRATYASTGSGGVIKLLLDNGADPFLENDYGISPDGLAHTIANYDVKQFFVNCKKDESSVLK